MKRVLVLIFCLALPFGLMAQERSGNITGTVTDAGGNPLPGVSLTLTGATIGPMTAVSNAEGKFRFLSLFPGNDYVDQVRAPGLQDQDRDGHHRQHRQGLRYLHRDGAGRLGRTDHGHRPDAHHPGQEDPDHAHGQRRDARRSAVGPRPVGRPADDARRPDGPREHRRRRIRAAVLLLRQGQHDPGMDDGRHADHGPQLGRLPRVLRLRHVRGTEHLDGHARRRAPRPGRRRQHRHPPRRQQDEPRRPVLLHGREVPVGDLRGEAWRRSA